MSGVFSLLLISAAVSLLSLAHEVDDPKPAATAKVEFRRAESKPGKGLEEAIVEGNKDKVYLHQNADLTNQDIDSAFVEKFESLNQYLINVMFTKEGSKKMTKLSKEHLHKPLAILIDGKVISAPIISSELSNSCVIAGYLKKEEAERIAKLLCPGKKSP